ncbi:MAG: protein tyrosine phosphatase family protein [Nostocaceae cyanobacterium]|nr:protein tyrosine phosphatase family protein [Nostocaceae cyanobacterium]
MSNSQEIMHHNCLENIYNFLQLSDKIATSGQPSKEEFSQIKQAKYQVVINLALPDSPDALADEKQIVESQGMEYIHIPVVWENPTMENVKTFFQAMEARVDKRIFIHCAANRRVAVFMYLYCRLYQGVSEEEAKKSLEQIWVPNTTWQKFIQDVMANYHSI